MSSRILVKLADEELEQLAQGGPELGPRLSKLLDEDLRDFDEILDARLGGIFTPIERAAVKTYLYMRLTNKIKSVESLEQRKIDVISEIIAPT
jgi:hypothetical protein